MKLRQKSNLKFIFLALFSFFLTHSLSGTEKNFNIVYVHIGDTLPTHLIESIRQTRLYNSDASIFLCGNSSAMRLSKKELRPFSINKISIETLVKSRPHQIFLKNTAFSQTNPFWIRTSERLFIVHELIKQKKLENVFHIESDVMIYGSFKDVLPAFVKNYPSIAIPFANDQAAICSIVFFKNETAAHVLADCIARHAQEGVNDMRLPGILKEEMGTSIIDHLPILPTPYVEATDDSLFTNKDTTIAKNKFDFCKHFDNFSYIFDAATFGVLLSRKNGSICTGTIFDPRVFTISWEQDERNLYRPYIQKGTFKCSLFNLHIHAKNMSQFRSDNKNMPTSWNQYEFQ